jgi:hypothetical protein
MNPNAFKAQYLGDEVWFIRDASYRDVLPPNAIAYTLAEAAILANRSESARRIVHQAKKLAGANVTKQPGLPGLPRQ